MSWIPGVFVSKGGGGNWPSSWARDGGGPSHGGGALRGISAWAIISKGCMGEASGQGELQLVQLGFGLH